MSNIVNHPASLIITEHKLIHRVYCLTKFKANVALPMDMKLIAQLVNCL